MSKFESIFADSVKSMESRKRKGSNELNCRGVPLPYLIRPRREVLTFDTLGFYNDYLEYSTNMEEIDNENAEDDSSMKAVETTSLDKGNCFGLGNESNASLSEIGQSVNDEKDDEYVIVDNVKPERVGAIQMMELSKDVPVSPTASDGNSQKDTVGESESEGEGSNSDEPESEGEGSNSDDWVVV